MSSHSSGSLLLNGISGSSSLASRFSKHNLANGRIVIHRNHVAVSAGEPRVSFPIRFDPLHDRPVDIVVSGSTPDGNGVNSPVSDGEIHIDSEWLRVVTLLLAQRVPLQRGELWHGRLADFDVARWRIDHEKPGQKEGGQTKSFWHMPAVYRKSRQNRREF